MDSGTSLPVFAPSRAEPSPAPKADSRKDDASTSDFAGVLDRAMADDREDAATEASPRSSDASAPPAATLPASADAAKPAKPGAATSAAAMHIVLQTEGGAPSAAEPALPDPGIAAVAVSTSASPTEITTATSPANAAAQPANTTAATVPSTKAGVQPVAATPTLGFETPTTTVAQESGQVSADMSTANTTTPVDDPASAAASPTPIDATANTGVGGVAATSGGDAPIAEAFATAPAETAPVAIAAAPADAPAINAPAPDALQDGQAQPDATQAMSPPSESASTSAPAATAAAQAAGQTPQASRANQPAKPNATTPGAPAAIEASAATASSAPTAPTIVAPAAMAPDASAPAQDARASASQTSPGFAQPATTPPNRTPDFVAQAAAPAAQRGEASAPSPQPAALDMQATTTASTAPQAHAASAARQAPTVAVQVATRFIERFDGRAQRFEISLNPEELGRVDVRIEVGSDKKVHAVLAAHDSAALTDLMRGQRSLERMLADAGVDLADGGLKFELNDNPRGGSARGETGADGRDPLTGASVWRGFSEVTVDVEADVPTPVRSWRPARLDLVA